MNLNVGEGKSFIMDVYKQLRPEERKIFKEFIRTFRRTGEARLNTIDLTGKKIRELTSRISQDKAVVDFCERICPRAYADTIRVQYEIAAKKYGKGIKVTLDSVTNDTEGVIGKMGIKVVGNPTGTNIKGTCSSPALNTTTKFDVSLCSINPERDMDKLSHIDKYMHTTTTGDMTTLAIEPINTGLLKVKESTLTSPTELQERILSSFN